MSGTFHVNHIIRFVEFALRSSGWKNVRVKSEPQTFYSYTFDAEKPFPGYKEPLRLTIILSYADLNSCFVLREFALYVKPKHEGILPYLDGSSFLTHYGLQPAVSGGSNKPLKGEWVIREGTNVQALFTMYDNLAPWWKCPKLFQPLGKTI